MTFNDPPKSQPGATEQQQVYALYKYLLETSAKLNLLQQELSASLTASDTSGPGDSTVVDAALSDTSSNPVRNSAVTAALAECARTDDLDAYLPLTGGTLTGDLTVGGSGTVQDDLAVTGDGTFGGEITSSVYSEASEKDVELVMGSYTSGPAGKLSFNIGKRSANMMATPNYLALYQTKTVLKQDLEDTSGVAYVKGSGTRTLTGTWNVDGYITSASKRVSCVLPIGLDWNITAVTSPTLVLRTASGGYVTDFSYSDANSDVTVKFSSSNHGQISIWRSDESAFDTTNNSMLAIALTCTLTAARDVS